MKEIRFSYTESQKHLLSPTVLSLEVSGGCSPLKRWSKLRERKAWDPENGPAQERSERNPTWLIMSNNELSFTNAEMDLTQN